MAFLLSPNPSITLFPSEAPLNFIARCFFTNHFLNQFERWKLYFTYPSDEDYISFLVLFCF